MIERLSLPEGQLINDPVQVRSFIGRILMDHSDRIVTLEPADYDLTPAALTTAQGLYRLSVHPNGEATSRSRAISGQSKVVRVKAEQIVDESSSGERVQSINAMTPFLVVAGAKKDRPGIYLFETVFYIP